MIIMMMMMMMMIIMMIIIIIIMCMYFQNVNLAFRSLTIISECREIPSPSLHHTKGTGHISANIHSTAGRR
jgi:hypothetical protein